MENIVTEGKTDTQMDQRDYFRKCLWNLTWDFTVEVNHCLKQSLD